LKRHILFALTMAALALAACEQGKPRHLPPDPMAAGPPPVEEAPLPPPMTTSLPKRPDTTNFFLDHIGAATDPRSRQPAVTPRHRPIILDGFGFDDPAKLPAKGVDLVIDGKVYGTAYGLSRLDVSHFFKAPALVNVGYRTVLPAGTLPAGPHTVIVRVVAADGKGYFESAPIPFSVN
jgi:hypothetical protein